MLKIKVTYFLNKKGMSYFPIWYAELQQEISKQKGFVGLRFEKDASGFSIFVSFTNQAMLNLWASTERHDEFVSKIELYFSRPEEVTEISSF